MGPNLLCPYHGKREDLDRHRRKLQTKLDKMEGDNKLLRKVIYGRGREKSGG